MIYLYMARRDKQGVRLVSVLQGQSNVPATRLSNIPLESLQLNYDWHKDIQSILHENRMMWEGWIESADSWQELKLKLRERGFRNVPNAPRPVYDKALYRSPPTANTSWIPETKVMLQINPQVARNISAQRMLRQSRSRSKS